MWLQTRQVVSSISTWENELFNIFISSLWFQAKAQSWVLPLNPQCLQSSVESGEGSALPPGSLCLPCCMRDTAWSWKKNISSTSINIKKYIHFRNKTVNVKQKLKVYKLQFKKLVQLCINLLVKHCIFASCRCRWVYVIGKLKFKLF